MPNGKTLFAYLLSIGALLGPFSYLFFAFYEGGRLGYFGAPTDFLQISSFGIRPVVEAIYPALLVTMLFLSFVFGMKMVPGDQKVLMVAAASTYVFSALWYVSLTIKWQWIFGILALISLIPALRVERYDPDVGNERSEEAPLPQPRATKYFGAMRWAVFGYAMIAVVISIWAAAGEKSAATQKFYWTAGQDVILGFYGELALTAELNGSQVGPRFQVVELKSLEALLKYQRIGPLTAAPMWKGKSAE